MPVWEWGGGRSIDVNSPFAKASLRLAARRRANGAGPRGAVERGRRVAILNRWGQLALGASDTPNEKRPSRQAQRGLAIAILAGLSLIAAGFVNWLAGFMGLFPGLFEVAAADPGAEEESVGVIALLGAPYGRYALAHLAGGALQMFGGSWLSWLARGPFVHSLAILCAVSIGLEAWSWALKGSLSFLATPGLVAAALTGTLYGRHLRTEPVIDRY